MTGFSKLVRDQIMCRSQGICERCGAAPAVQIHHRRPRGMGGSSAADTNRASNGLAVCVSCHTDIEANRGDSLKYGFLVRQGQNPAEIGVLRMGEWVLLRDDDGFQRVRSEG